MSDVATTPLRLTAAVERLRSANGDAPDARRRVVDEMTFVLGRSAGGPHEHELQRLLELVLDEQPVTDEDLANIAHLELAIRTDPPTQRSENEPRPEPARALEFVSLQELIRQVRDAPPVGFLVRPVWPADAHGMLAAEKKAGKTWAVLDLVVSVAAAVPWLGRYDVETPGPVLVFLGEGGKRKMLRRIDAVCRAKGVELDVLAGSGLVELCARVPHLSNEVHLAEIQAKIAQHQPVLVIVDPLYLAARGAKGSDLYAMGEHLERIQLITQQAGCALAIVHHWNQTGRGSGADRMSGAGPAEWGRVIVSVAVHDRKVDDNATIVTLDWNFIGDEIPDTSIRLRRRVWADDPDDLASPLHYELAPVEPEAKSGGWDGPTHCMDAVVAFLRDHPGEEVSKSRLPEKLRAIGHAFKDKTVREAAETLAARGDIGHRPGPRNADLYSWPPTHDLRTEET